MQIRRPWGVVLVLLAGWASAEMRLDETVPESDKTVQPLDVLIPEEVPVLPSSPKVKVAEREFKVKARSNGRGPIKWHRSSVEARGEEAYAQSKAVTFGDLLTGRPGSFDRGQVEAPPRTEAGSDRTPIRADVEWRPPLPPTIEDLTTPGDQEEDNWTGLNAHSYPSGVMSDAASYHQAATPDDSSINRQGSSNYKIVCYYGQWAAYRREPATFNPADVDAETCTHLIYSFVGLDNSSLTLKVLDYDFDVIRGGYKASLALKDINPDLKVMVAIGGWAEGGEQYSRMVASSESRQKFIDSVVKFMERHGFDGLDLDWEFPGVKYRGGRPEDRDNFADLVEELADVFRPRGWLLSAAVNLFVTDGYDISRLSDSLDFINAMTYDLHGAWDEYADHHAPLRRRPFDEADTVNLHVEGGVALWRQMGAAPEKLIVGVPFYGRSFTLKDPTAKGPRPAITGVGSSGPFTREPGYLAYYEICRRLQNGNWEIDQDPAGSPFAVRGNQWIGYDTPESLKAKMDYIRKEGLGGAMIWAIDLDDFKGLCGPKWPLLSAIHSGLREKRISTTEGPPVVESIDVQESIQGCTEDGYYVDPFDCGLFYRCYGEISYPFTCPDGLWFDLGTLTCNYPFLVECPNARGAPVDAPIKASEQLFQSDSSGAAAVARSSPEYNIACYFSSWAWLRGGDASFIPENVPVDSCTHLLYAYVGLDPNELVLQRNDRWTDFDNKFYDRTVALKQLNPDLKVLLALGGWTDSSGDKYSRLVSSASARSNFAQQAAQFVQQVGFDGLHLDWQFPVCWQADCSRGPSSDKTNYVLLAQELRKELDKRGLMLSANLVAYPSIAKSAFDAAQLAKYVDFLSVPAFDYHGSWERVTGHTAPLNSADSLNVANSMKYWLSQGVAARKLLVGIPFYGQSFTLDNAAITRDQAAVGVRARGAGYPGQFTKQSGMLAYYEICSLVRKKKWTVVTEGDPYAYAGNQWVGFDSIESVRRKAEYIKKGGFGGAMIWSVDMDDFSNMCCLEAFPLLRTVARSLGIRSDSAPPAGNCNPPPPPVTTSTEKPTTPYDSGNGQTTVAWPQTTPRPPLRPGVGVDATTPSGGSNCEEGKYYPAPEDCSLFYRCVQGNLRAQKCSTGLHWNPELEVCDWPRVSKCSPADAETTPSIVTVPVTMPGLTVGTTRPTTKPQTTPRPTTTRPSTTSSTTTTTPRTTTTSTTTTTTPRPTTTRATRPTTTRTTRPTTTRSTTTRPATSRPSRCEDGEYYPSATSCSIYKVCDNGRLVSQQCPAGLHWNAQFRYCDWPRTAQCPLSSASVIKEQKGACNEQTDQFRSHPSKCTSYQLCLHGKWIDQSCPAGLHWNDRANICDWPINAACVLGATSSSRPPTTTTTSRPATTRPTAATTTTSTTASSTTTTRTTTTTPATTRPTTATSTTTTTTKTTTTTTPPTTTTTPATTRPTTATSTTTTTRTTTTAPTTTTRTTTRPTTATSTTKRPTITTDSSDKKVICYYTNWSWYRQGIGKFSPSDIDVNLCTHVMYGFAVLDANTLLMKVHDSWCDTDQYGPKLYQKVTSLKEQGIKVLIALGGWNDSEFPKYSQLVNVPAARKRFIDNAIQFIDKYGFQGLDLDWEYPVCWQVDCKKGPASDKEGFAALVRELRAEFNPRGWLLTAAVSPSKKVIDEAYDVPSISRDLDWIGVMSYDYHGHFDKTTDHSAPLYFHSETEDAQFNTNFTLHYWIEKGADPAKLIMGIPTYGRAVKLANPKLNGMGAPIAGAGDAGPWTKAKGFLAYYEICRSIAAGGWTVVQDDEGAQGPYAYKGTNWVSYDDTAIVRRKAELARSMNIGGAMIWALDFDDFRNACGCEPYPVLRTINRVLRNYPPIQSDCVIEESAQLPTAAPEVSGGTGGSSVGGGSPESGSCEEGSFKPDPSDCSAYFHCVAGNWLSQQCPAGLNWSQDHCDWPYNAQCNGTTGGGAIYVPTTQSPTIWWSPPTTTTTPSPYPQVTLPDTGYKVICYFTNWAWYRPDSGKYTPDSIDSALCTHVIYGFVVLHPTDLVLKVHDPWADVDNKFFERVIALKKKGVKVSVGLGGWNDSLGDKYSRLVNDPAARKRFIDNAIQFIQKYGFDGMDLDWEYPKCWQVDCKAGPDSDKEGFTEWVKELSAEFKPRGWLLSAAVSPSKAVIDAAYDVAELSDHFDWIGVMTYDYFGNWDKETGHVAPMYEHEDLAIPYFNTNFTLNYWKQLGADPKKLIMGIPMYGQSFTLRDPKINGLGAPASGPGEAGQFTRQGGFLSYYEICQRINSKGWTVVQDPTGAMGPYAYRGNQWTSFDDVNIIRRKSELVRTMGIGGAMIWALDLDDFRNTCGCEHHPLLRTINRVLRAYPVPDPDCSLKASPLMKMSHSAMSSASQSVPVKLLSLPAPAASDSGRQVVCRFTNWAHYRSGDGAFQPEDVDFGLCTHIVYSYATLDQDEASIQSSDQRTDIDDGFYRRITSLANQRGVKVLISLGGWEDSADGNKYSRLVADPESRWTFVDSAVQFMERHGFHGLHLDWKYPKCWQADCSAGPDSDQTDFATFVAELRSSLEPRGLLLSASVPASASIIDAAYDVPKLTRHLNWMTVETYDYHGHWDGRTGHAAALYADAADDAAEAQNNVNFTIHHLIKSGADKKKLVMALPFYGQTFTLSDSDQHGTGAAVDGPGRPGKFSRTSGFLPYYEVCERVRKRGWQVNRADESRAGPYAYGGDQWVSYDDISSIRRKSEFIRSLDIGGAAVWSLDADDFRNRCGQCRENPLLRSVNRVLRPDSLANDACDY